LGGQSCGGGLEKNEERVGFVVFGRRFLWPFGGVHGRKGIVSSSLKAKLCTFKISSSTFCDSYIVGVMLFYGERNTSVWNL